MAEKIPLLTLSLATCVIALIARSDRPRDVGLTIVERSGNVVLSCLTYIRQMIYPIDLAVLYPYPDIKAKIAEIIIGILLLAGITTICFVYRKRIPALLVGWLWFLGLLIPASGIIQVGWHAHADRYTYLPQIGLYLAVAWGMHALVYRSPRFRRFLPIGSVLIVASLAACTFRDVEYWRDTETLWRHAISVTSDNYIAFNNLGLTLVQSGRIDEAIENFRRAIAINQNDAEAYNNLGSALMASYRQRPWSSDSSIFAEIVRGYQKSLELRPHFADAEHNLGVAYCEEGTALLQTRNIAKAVDYLQRGVDFNPDYAEAQNNLGVALMRQNGGLDAATSHFLRAIELNPNYAKAESNLAGAFVRKGKIEEALFHVERALQVKPDYAEGHYDLACLLAQLGHRAQAIAHLNEALRLRPDYTAAQQELRNLVSLDLR